MKKINFKIILSIAIAVVTILSMYTISYGTNDELVIVKESESEYIIYMKQYLNQEFEFAFSNVKESDVATLTFINSAIDAPENGANNIAYVDDGTVAMFTNPTYMWVKVNGEIKVSSREIDLKDNITKTELASVGTTSKIIPIKLEQEQIVNAVNEEGTKITETVGVVKVEKEITNGEYQLIKRETSTESDNLFALAELIEKNEFTDSYTKIKASKEFVELYNSQINNLNVANWKKIEESKIQQPKDTQTGDQYILWVKGDNIQDVHFLTSIREYEEEFIQEEVKTKLPYTYDNNTVLIALGVVVIAIIAVSIRIATLKKKEMNK